MAEPTMTCDGCGRPTDGNPYGCCSWACYARPRDPDEDLTEVTEAAPAAFAFFTAPPAARSAEAPKERPAPGTERRWTGLRAPHRSKWHWPGPWRTFRPGRA
ncbi:hypothetical protein [Kitasatospora sp. NPDC050543]|uniref:hypothetical protein n=1 Tax=Kitasatospora sp. NPDC050543 TaxID=3364054 RepID=UPI00378857EF